MIVDATLRGAPLPQAAELAARAEAVGFGGVYFTETNNDPFLQVALSAGSTSSAQIGTAIALAFPRSPMDVAYSAWDLQRLCEGRFVLGLGTQIRAHVERRYGATWSSPAPRIADFVRALRAIWECFETGGELNYEGEFYSHTLMPPNFRAEPLPDGVEAPPVMLAGVRERMLETVGEVGDGLLGHSLQTPKVIAEVTIPAIERGLERSGRSREEFQIGAGVFAATSEQRWETIRNRIAFYGSTPGYRHVLDAHDLGDVHEELHRLSREDGWAKMPELISDEIMDLFVVRATDPAAGAAEIKRRYAFADRIGLDAGDRSEPEEWAELVAALGA